MEVHRNSLNAGRSRNRSGAHAITPQRLDVVNCEAIFKVILGPRQEYGLIDL